MRLLLLALLILHAATAQAAAATIAVATNFLRPAEALALLFEQQTGREVTLVSGSTGKLTAQIIAGAPFDALLAADQERPERLEKDGLARPGSRFTYALGRLALWSADPDRIAGDGAAELARGDFRRLALANPALAPYGAAARETLEGLGLADALADRIVLGENIGQAHAMVATGNAELGFVALSGVAGPGAEPKGSMWIVPEELHAPIRQDAVLLARAPQDGDAAAFLDFLKSPEARAVIAAWGYGTE